MIKTAATMYFRWRSDFARGGGFGILSIGLTLSYVGVCHKAELKYATSYIVGVIC